MWATQLQHYNCWIPLGHTRAMVSIAALAVVWGPRKGPTRPREDHQRLHLECLEGQLRHLLCVFCCTIPPHSFTHAAEQSNHVCAKRLVVMVWVILLVCSFSCFHPSIQSVMKHCGIGDTYAYHCPPKLLTGFTLKGNGLFLYSCGPF
jgi:hypothetical protein